MCKVKKSRKGKYIYNNVMAFFVSAIFDFGGVAVTKSVW